MNDDFTFEIEERIVVLSRSPQGWTKELNKVSFNGNPAKYDIREWSPDHKKMGKGVSLTDEEANLMAATIADRWIKNKKDTPTDVVPNNIVAFPGTKQDIEQPIKQHIEPKQHIKKKQTEIQFPFH